MPPENGRTVWQMPDKVSERGAVPHASFPRWCGEKSSRPHSYVPGAVGHIWGCGQVGPSRARAEEKWPRGEQEQPGVDEPAGLAVEEMGLSSPPVG